MKNIPSLIKNTFIILFSITLYSTLSIYSERVCSKVSSKKCSIAKTLVYPGSKLLDSYIDTRIFFYYLKELKTFNLSGLIAISPSEVKERFIGLKPGFTFNYVKGSRRNAGYLFLSRVDIQEDSKGSFEIWDMNQQELIHKYKIDVKNISLKSGHKLNGEFKFYHPLIFSDGSVVFTATNSAIDTSLIIKIDRCGKYLASRHDYYYHHTIEKDKSGNLYIPITIKTIENNTWVKKQKGYRDEGFAVLDSDLNVIKKIWLEDIYRKNGLITDIFGGEAPPKDPYHINDVSPFHNDKGEIIVLLSLRNQSSLLAYNIDKDNLIWKIERATSLQHDIDIINQRKNLIDISIFNNNSQMGAFMRSSGNEVVTFKNLPSNSKPNFILIADSNSFESYDMYREDFNWLDAKYRPRTPTEGIADFIPINNSLMLEESDYARLFEVDLINNKILWQYLNIQESSRTPYQMSWSRRVNELPKVFKSKIGLSCPME